MNLADTTKSDLKRIGRRLLNSKSLWMQAAKVLDTVKKHLIDPDTIAVSALETEWDELKKFLLAFEVELPPEYIALRKVLKAVRRPYYSRSVFLVSKCRELATHFTSTPEIRSAENIPVLKHTISKVMVAIGKAEENVNDHPDLDNEAVTAFDEAFDQLKTSFSALKLGGDGLEIDRDEASKTDQSVNKKFEESKQPAPPQAPDSVTVTVKVDNADTSFTVGMDTTLRTISYQLALRYTLDKRLRLLSGRFTKADGTTVVPNDQTVSALLSSDGPGRPDSLRLNFGDPIPSSPSLDDDTSNRAEENEEDEDEEKEKEDEDEDEGEEKEDEENEDEDEGEEEGKKDEEGDDDDEEAEEDEEDEEDQDEE
jgi:hypothetical protein